MKVLTCSRHFPKGHPKEGQPTLFVEKILNSIYPGERSELINRITPEVRDIVNDFFILDGQQCKHHTIRAGSRFNPGDMASLRVWSDKPYRSKQIEFAQVEVKKVWEIKIHIVNGSIGININGQAMKGVVGPLIARNEGLEWIDFVNWFNIHPKKKSQLFTGQIICWSDSIEYKPSILTEKI